jgi:hypothetical protein
LTKQLYISFDGSPLKVTSEYLALSFLHAFGEELKSPVPKLESFRSVNVSKLLTWLEFHYLNDLYLTEDEVYYLRYVHFNLYNLYQSAAIEDVYFRVLQNDFTGLVTIRK